jgi:hypothetical protein
MRVPELAHHPEKACPHLMRVLRFSEKIMRKR